MADTRTKKTITIDLTGIGDVVDQYAAAFNDHDVDAMLALYTDDCEMLWQPVGLFRGKDECGDELTALLTAFPDIERSEKARHVADGVVTCETHVTGTFSGGPFAGFQPNGQAGGVDSCEVLTITDGRISRTAIYWDGMQMAHELGLMPDDDSLAGKAMTSMINLASTARRRLRR